MPSEQESMQTAAVHATDTSGQVQEYLLTEQQTGSRQWLLQRDNISIKDKAVFAPATCEQLQRMRSTSSWYNTGCPKITPCATLEAWCRTFTTS